MALYDEIPVDRRNRQVPTGMTAAGKYVPILVDDDGKQFVNQGLLTFSDSVNTQHKTTPTAVSVNVTTSSAQVLAANAGRSYLFIQNPPDNAADIYIRPDGQAATLASPSIPLEPGDIYLEEGNHITPAAIFAIHGASGNVPITIYEAS